MGASEDCKKIFEAFVANGSDLSNHSLGVLNRLVEIHHKLGLEPSTEMCNTALMHDIGYSEQISTEVRKGNPELVGYMMLKDSNKVYANVIREHKKGNSNKLDTELERVATAVLDYCDLTVNSKGSRCKVEERYEDIKRIYGEDSKEYKQMKELESYYTNICLGIKEALLDLNRLESLK